MKHIFCFACVLAVALVAVTGCSGKKSGEARIELTLPKQFPKAKVAAKSGDIGAFYTAADIQHIVVNVSGAGMAVPAYFSWDRHNNTAVPTTIQMTVPKGTQRLIQVLFVFGVEDGPMDFHYGEAVKDLSLESESVTVALSASGGSSGKEGRIAGRYIRADGTAPTGYVQGRFNPPTGRAPMIVTTSEIFNGWFNFFVLDGVGFTYSMDDGTVLFSKATMADTSIVWADETSTAFNEAARTMRVIVPPYYYSHDAGGTRYRSEGQMFTLGFFGPGASNRAICYDLSATPQDLSYMYAASTGTQTIKWRSNAEPVPTATPAEAGILSVNGARGGATTGSAACSVAGGEFDSYIKFSHDKISQRDGVLGFKGPYKQFSGSRLGGTTTLDYQLSGSTLTLEWSYLPGVTSNGITGSAVFMRSGINTRDDIEFEDGIACQKLTQLPTNPFTLVSDVPATSGTTATVTGVDANLFSQNQVQVIVCPYVNLPEQRRYYTSALSLENWGGGQATATKLALLGPDRQLTTAATPLAAYNITCIPLTIEGQDNSGNPAYFPQDTAVTLSGSDINYDSFFSDANCSIGSEWPYQLGGGTETTIFYKSSRSVTFASTLTVTDANSGLADGSLFVSLTNQVGDADWLVVKAPASIKAHTCYDVSFQTRIGNAPGVIANYSSNSLVNFPVVTDLNFYDNYDHACAGIPVSGPFGIGNGTQVASYKMKYTGADSSITITPAFNTGFSSNFGSASISVSQPGTASTLIFNGPKDYAAETCQGFFVSLVDNNGNPAPVTSSMNSGNPVTVTLGVSGATGTFYQYSGCSTGVTSSIDIAVGETSGEFWFESLSSGNATMTASTALTGMNVNYNVNIQPAVASGFKILFPGQSISSGVVTGAPLTQSSDTEFSLSLIATTSNGIVDTNFNDTLSALSVTGPAGVNMASPNITFLNGYATLGVTYLTPQASGNSLNISGNLTNTDWFGSTSSSDIRIVPGPAESLNIYSSPMIKTGTCQPAMFTLENSQNARPLVAGSESFSKSTVTSNPDLYIAADCLTAVVPTFTANESAKIYYVKHPTDSTYDLQFATSSPSGLAGAGMSSIAGGAGSPTTATKILIHGSLLIYKDTCQPYMVATYDATDQSSAPAATVNVTMSATGLDGAFYGDPYCITQKSTVTLDPSMKADIVYFKPSTENQFGSIGTINDGSLAGNTLSVSTQ